MRIKRLSMPLGTLTTEYSYHDYENLLVQTSKSKYC